jgi:histidine kinase/DNA gyrase B/HSP90-like ATPase
MILNAGRQADVHSMGMEEAKDMTIDAASTDILMRILSEGLYSDPIGSTIREWVSNSLDSHIEAGVNEPVIVEIVQDKNWAWKFRTTDFGVGISPERQENVISKYAASTKRQSTTMLGAFGLGLKAGLAYADSFTYITRFDGTEYMYIMYKGEFGKTKIDKLYEKPTSEKNGTTFEIQIKDWNDKARFVDKCRQQLCYFENVYFKVDGISNDFKIVKSEEWKYSEINSTKNLHLSLDNVYYGLDYNQLGIPSISLPIALNFRVDEGLEPLPNRESIKMTPSVKEMILKKIESVCTYFVDKYNEGNREFDCFSEIWHLFGLQEAYTIPGTNISIVIKDLLRYSTTKKLTQPTLRGINKINLEHLASQGRYYMFFDYYFSERVRNGRWDSKYHETSPRLYESGVYNSSILAKSAPKGVLKDYIKDKYDGFKILHKSASKRPLGRAYKAGSQDHTYVALLGLRQFPKREWRERIKEYQEIENRILSKIIKIEDIIPDEKWLEDRKANRKKAKKVLVTKQELNIRWASSGSSGKILFDSSGPILMSDAQRLKRLNVYGTIDQKDQLENIWRMGAKNKKIATCWLPARDLVKLEKTPLHNFITIEQFMAGTTKPFKIYVTAIRISELMSKYNQCFSTLGRTLVGKLNTELAKNIDVLVKYKNENYVNMYDKEFTASLLVQAEESQLWDTSIIHVVKQTEQICKEYLDFLNPIVTYVPKTVLDENYFIKAMADILKYRQFKLNLEHYSVPAVTAALPTEFVPVDDIVLDELELIEF